MWDAAEKVPDPLRTKLLEACEKNDASFLKNAHDLSDPKRGFVSTADLVTLRPAGYCGSFTARYGIDSNAQVAMMLYERYLQCGRVDFRDLILDTANMYLHCAPDADKELYPGAFGDVICVMVAANRLSSNPAYLARAKYFADQAIAQFWADGPLPRASSRTIHYETITRADTLARALFVLAEELGHREVALHYIDR